MLLLLEMLLEMLLELLLLLLPLYVFITYLKGVASQQQQQHLCLTVMLHPSLNRRPLTPV